MSEARPHIPRWKMEAMKAGIRHDMERIKRGMRPDEDIAPLVGKDPADVYPKGVREKARRWTDEDGKIVRDAAAVGKTTTEAAALVGRTVSSVQNWAHVNGVHFSGKPGPKRRWGA